MAQLDPFLPVNMLPNEYELLKKFKKQQAKLATLVGRELGSGKVTMESSEVKPKETTTLWDATIPSVQVFTGQLRAKERLI